MMVHLTRAASCFVAFGVIVVLAIGGLASCTRSDGADQRREATEFMEVEVSQIMQEWRTKTGNQGIAFKASPKGWASRDPYEGNEVFAKELARHELNDSITHTITARTKKVGGRQLFVDPWGTPYFFGILTFSKFVQADASDVNGNHQVEQLRSAGPNGNFGDADDLVFVRRD